MSDPSALTWHGTTILCVRKDGKTVLAGDGQVSMGQTIVKSNARKVRRLGDGSVIGDGCCLGEQSWDGRWVVALAAVLDWTMFIMRPSNSLIRSCTVRRARAPALRPVG